MELTILWGMKMIEKLEILLREKGLTQASLEQRVMLSENRISKWKNGTGEPTGRQALRMARILGVPVEYLLDDEMDELPQAPPESSREMMVWEFVREIGADEAWKILVGSRRSGQEPAPAPGVRVLRPSITTPGETNKGVG